MLIDRIYSTVKSFMQKHDMGLIDPESFNNAANYVHSKIINNLYNEYIKEKNRATAGYSPKSFYDKLSDIKRSLSMMYTTHTMVLDVPNNIFTLPTDLRTTDLLIWKGLPIAEVNLKEYYDRVNVGMMSDVTNSFMMYIIDQDGLITIPMLTESELLVDTLEMAYFRLPNTVAWNYTEVSGKPVFDATTSTDFDLHEGELERITREILLFLGAELRDVNTVQVMQAENNANSREDAQLQ